jgi:hypothetical protein
MRWKCVRCGQAVAAATESAVESEGWKIVALIEELISAQPALCPECQKGATPLCSRSSGPESLVVHATMTAETRRRPVVQGLSRASAGSAPQLRAGLAR